MFPYEHIIIIDKESKIPVYRQIAISIINAIRSGTLKAGTHLPSSRELAKKLGVHRKTVVAGYEELDAQDWIMIVPRKHVAVSEHIPLLKPQKWSEPKILTPYENDLDIPFRIIEENSIGKNAVSYPDIIIDDGHPDVRLSPIDDLLKTYRSLTSKKYAIKNANIGTTQGTLKLREELVNYLSVTRGLNISVDNILITHGAQMSIYLSAQLLLGHSSNIIVGKPNYPVANKTFEETEAKIIEVNVDEKGIDTDAIERICKRKKIDAVYVIPHHHYPTTVTLSVERRIKLLELSKQFSFAIIEDDYDYDYHYTSSPYLPLASGNHNGNVIYIGSFSKILDPALRIGFMVAPKNFIEQCTAFRKIIDVGGDGYMQSALATLIKEDELKRHLKKSKKCYHERRDLLDALLKEKLGKYVSYTLPTGGMAIWVKLNPKFSIARLVANTQFKIIRWDLEQNAFRFGFASINEVELIQAVEALKSSLEAGSKHSQ
ncbi:PLP-dependent aminotransferase family protein [Epilithonimonas pallida]|uniref:GntR family transcriptional regulator / MocR family aminotransferase n=1 Tax=Epilithonimonas pallida TaxID=373671 RepID=A0ABY1R065_9FLAO|nr:PLP-dependent aminotransferase family protein [Epilithonimonas pallida]SMP91326.1 GntR family transcriptional regulator / MocR family aminotransferase [Epilithonimonas pallida]